MDKDGLLPAGIHDCTIDEAAQGFGSFRGTDRRPRLWEKFAEFLAEATACQIIKAVLVDGSFVTAAASPNDIDLVLLTSEVFDLSADLAPTAYNLLSQSRVRQRFGFDIVVVKSGSESLEQAAAFFQQVKHRPSVRKGILRIWL